MGLDAFTFIHIALSLVGIASGFVVLGGFLANAHLEGATFLFLATTVATSVTGFGFPFTQLLPSHIVGIISLAVLAAAIYAIYVARLSGPWRLIYVATATAVVYLNVFVLVVQTFVKNPALNAMAPTQSEPVFIAAQGATLVAFAVLGLVSIRRFRGAPAIA